MNFIMEEPWNSCVICFQMWNFSQGIMLMVKVAILAYDSKSPANIWAFETPAQGWGGRVHQKPVVWLIQHLRRVRAETSLLGVYCKSCQTCSVSRNDCLLLSMARFQSPWEVSSKQDSMKSSQDAWRGWGVSRSYTLIGVNSDLSHIACKLMGIGILGHFKEPW